MTCLASPSCITPFSTLLLLLIPWPEARWSCVHFKCWEQELVCVCALCFCVFMLFCVSVCLCVYVCVCEWTNNCASDESDAMLPLCDWAGRSRISSAPGYRSGEVTNGVSWMAACRWYAHLACNIARHYPTPSPVHPHYLCLWSHRLLACDQVFVLLFSALK